MNIIIHRDGETHQISVSGAPDDIDQIIERHGFDPDADYEIELSEGERLKEVENAVGRDGPGKRGVAQRIDELEDRVAELEDNMS